MTATAIFNDHLDLANIGVNTHAQIDTAITVLGLHIADTDIHFADTGIDGIPYVREDNAWATLAGAAVGVVDHGGLLGLADDDHINYFFALGRAGGQSMIGGTGPVESIELRGSSDADLGTIFMQSPVEFQSISASGAPYAFNYNATESYTGAFIGGGLNMSGTIAFSNPTFIYESFRGAPAITTGVNPGFSAYTVLQALPIFHAGSGAGHNPLNPLVINCAPRVSNGFAGTRTVSTSAVINGGPTVQATVSGATMNVTAMTGMIFAPKYSTVAGSTIGFGIVRGLHGQNITAALFAPSAGVENMTRYALVDCNDITFGGTVERAVVRSAMTAGTGKYFLLNTANALSEFNSSWCHFNNNFGVQFGDTPVQILQTWDTTQSALRFSNAFGSAGAESLYLRPNNGDEWVFQHHNGGAADIGIGFNVNAVVFGTTLPTPNSNNWFVQFAAPNQRQVQIGGEYSDVLWTAGGSIDVNGLAVSDLQAFKINSPAVILNGGTIQDISNLFVQAMPSFGATRTQALRVLGRARLDGHINNGGRDAGTFAVQQNDLSMGANNGQRTMNRIRGSAAFTITGIDSSFGFAQTGDRICLYNDGAFAITFTNQDVASLAANRIITSTGVAYIIGPNECVWFWYDDSGTARWRMLEGTGA